jgi:prophage regulatory protein
MLVTQAAAANDRHPPPSIDSFELELIRRPELLRLVPFSSVTLWRWERNGEFPKRLQVGRRAVAWRRSEILAWLAGRPSAQGRSAQLTSAAAGV